MSPSEFYELTIYDANLIMDRHNEKLKRDFELSQIALQNVVWTIVPNSKHEQRNPFEEVKPKKKITKETVSERIARVNSIFNTDIDIRGGDS